MVLHRALAVLWKLVRDEKAEGKIGTIKKMDQVFGLRLLEVERVEVPDDVRELAEERDVTRKSGDYKKSDKLRDEIAAKGWSVKDGKDGFLLERL